MHHTLICLSFLTTTLRLVYELDIYGKIRNRPICVDFIRDPHEVRWRLFPHPLTCINCFSNWGLFVVSVVNNVCWEWKLFLEN